MLTMHGIRAHNQFWAVMIAILAQKVHLVYVNVNVNKCKYCLGEARTWMYVHMLSYARVTGDFTVKLLGETITNHTIMCFPCMSENDDNHRNIALWTQMMSINCIPKSGIAPIKPKPLHLISMVLISRKMWFFRFVTNGQLSLMAEYSENSQEWWK